VPPWVPTRLKLELICSAEIGVAMAFEIEIGLAIKKSN
jgi:hypothetical protein